MKYVSYLIKPASSTCNLRCKYCFYEDESKNREVKSFNKMSKETMQNVIKKGFDALNNGGHISFAFQGGEPTVAGLDFFRDFVNKVKELKPVNIEVSFSIQTNGTLLNDEWCEFFHNENFLVGISLDGYKELHNKNRIDINKEKTWNKVCHSLDLLNKHKVDTNALCVVTKDCARNPSKAYKSLKELGFRYIQFIGCLDFIDKKRGTLPWSLSPCDYGNFLCEVFDLWFKDWQNGDYHSIRLFDDYIHALLNDNMSTCATCGACGGYFVIEGNGNVYPCDFYCLDDWKCGNINELSIDEIKENVKYKEFLDFGKEKPKKCQLCKYRMLCNGGCKNDWEFKDNKYENYYCKSFMMLFNHAYDKMVYIAKTELQKAKLYNN